MIADNREGSEVGRVSDLAGFGLVCQRTAEPTPLGSPRTCEDAYLEGR